jgi:hypothetical protein
MGLVCKSVIFMDMVGQSKMPRASDAADFIN